MFSKYSTLPPKGGGGCWQIETHRPVVAVAEREQPLATRVECTLTRVECTLARVECTLVKNSGSVLQQSNRFNPFKSV